MTPSEGPGRGVLLLGCGPTALAALESLVARFPVVGMVRAANSHDANDALIRQRAAGFGVPIIWDASLSTVERLITELRPACVVVSSFHRILPPRILAHSRFVNVHYAPLPRYRGRATINWAIINGESTATITIHVLVPELDSGNILFQRSIPIEVQDTVHTVYKKLNVLLCEHLGEVVARHLTGHVGYPQNHTRATYGCTRLPQDGEIDWSQPTRDVHNLIRALHEPYHGAFTYLNAVPIRIWQSEPVANSPVYAGRIPGRVIAVSRCDGCVEVLTGDGVLRVLEVEPEGNSRRPAADVITSVKCTLGLNALDLLDRLRALELAIEELRRNTVNSFQT